MLCRRLSAALGAEFDYVSARAALQDIQAAARSLGLDKKPAKPAAGPLVVESLR